MKEEKGGSGDGAGEQQHEGGGGGGGRPGSMGGPPGSLQANGTPPLSTDHLHLDATPQQHHLHHPMTTFNVKPHVTSSSHGVGYAVTSYGHIATPMTSITTHTSANNTPVGT